jgi:hypothetical protein
VAGGDFDPGRDIEAIAVNRWNYGYAYELTSIYDPSLFGPVANQPQVKGRRPYRNVAIAIATREPSPTRTARSTRPTGRSRSYPASASRTICTGWRACTPTPCAICWRHETPVAATSVPPSSARRAGNSRDSPICIDSS